MSSAPVMLIFECLFWSMLDHDCKCLPRILYPRSVLGCDMMYPTHSPRSKRRMSSADGWDASDWAA